MFHYQGLEFQKGVGLLPSETMTDTVGAAAHGDPDSAVRQRTRRDILRAAVGVWSRDFSASMGDIAERAGVSRSTLHRYYPERQLLVEAAAGEALGALERTAVRSTTRATTAREELLGLLEAIIVEGDAVIFLFSEPSRFAAFPGWGDQADTDPAMIALIERAQAEGSVRAEMTPRWVIDTFYSLGYVAAEGILAGRMSLPEAIDVAARTFFGGVGADVPPA